MVENQGLRAGAEAQEGTFGNHDLHQNLNLKRVEELEAQLAEYEQKYNQL